MADEFGRMSVVATVGGGPLPELQPVVAGAADGAVFTPAAEKYDVSGTIGQGGMGEVLLVEDRDLRRQIAMNPLEVVVEGCRRLTRAVGAACSGVGRAEALERDDPVEQGGVMRA